MAADAWSEVEDLSVDSTDRSVRNSRVHSTTQHARNVRPLAVETRFLVAEPSAAEIGTWARRHLHADPHGTGEHGDEYETTTIYFDTADYCVFQQVGSYGRAKYRIRRYQDGAMFVERKLRRSGLVSKRRTPIDAADLARLADAAAGGGWHATWFQDRLRARRLRPSALIQYHRTARVGLDGTEGYRLTLDRHVCAASIARLTFSANQPVPLLDRQTIVEIKFRGSAPRVFKEMVERFALAPVSVSKYRRAISVFRERIEGSAP